MPRAQPAQSRRRAYRRAPGWDDGYGYHPGWNQSYGYGRGYGYNYGYGYGHGYGYNPGAPGGVGPQSLGNGVWIGPGGRITDSGGGR